MLYMLDNESGPGAPASSVKIFPCSLAKFCYDHNTRSQMALASRAVASEGGNKVPVVTVQLWEGRTVEQKRKLVRAITDAMVEHAGVNPDGLHVIVQDVPKDSWGRAGVLGIDREDVKNGT